MSNEKVTISMEEYTSLLDSSFLLQCLENAGVDNWSGYSDAMDEYHNMEDDDE